MPPSKAQISLWTNNFSLKNFLLNQDFYSDIHFSDKQNIKTQYSLFIIDNSCDLENVSQELISHYSLCREFNQKLTVLLIHKETLDIEKNLYFQKMLEDIGREKPLHRLVFTKDLYTTKSQKPITFFDEFLNDTILSRKIYISQKGENYLYPLSVNDLFTAILKIFFLTDTAGKSFWLIGDPYKDLDLAYLIKKNIETADQSDLEINAIKTIDQKVNTLSSFSNQTRSDLNWNTNSDFEIDIKTIVKNYLIQVPLSISETNQKKLLSKITTWYLEKRYQSRREHLPRLKVVVRRLILQICLLYLGIILIFISVTFLSLYELNNSFEQALKGNLNNSVFYLNKSQKISSIGESTLNLITPASNIFSTHSSEKIYNLYSFNNYAGTSLSNLQQTYVLAQSLYSSFDSTKNTSIVNYQDISLALHANLSQIYENLNQIKFLTQEGKLPLIIDHKIKTNSQYKNIQVLEEQIVQFIKLTDLIPKILRSDKTINLLVLVQNSQISKPSGGQIDYYLLLTLNQGHLLSKTYFTPHEIDSLVSSIENPPSQKNKKSSQLIPFSTNINNNPDFSLSSEFLSQNIEKNLKIKPDFILSINDQLITTLLTEENSPQSKTFLSDYVSTSGGELQKKLLDQYLERFFNNDLSLPVIARTLAKIIDENQLYLWSSDIETERLISAQTFSGIIQPHLCHSGLATGSLCHSETTYLAESLTSEKRNNPWLNRTQKHFINIQDQSISHRYQIDYQNKQDATPGLTINTLYDLYLPQGATLDQLLLDDLPASLSLAEKRTNFSLDRYSIPLVLSGDQKHQVVIVFHTSFPSKITPPFSYSLTEYRQSGVTDFGTELTIKYPEQFQPSLVTQPITSGPSTLKITLPKHTSTFGFTLIENRQ